MRISIVICCVIENREDLDFLENLIRMVGSAKRYDDEIVVCQNGSLKWSARLLLKRGYDFLFVHAPILGLARARNVAVNAATGEAIAFIDIDCFPHEDWINQIHNSLESFEVDYGGGEILVFFPDRNKNLIGNILDAETHLRNDLYHDWGYYAGANMWVRKSAFERVGMFRDDLLALSDKDWGLRAKEEGLRREYRPGAIVYHPARDIWGFWAKLRRQTWAKNQMGDIGWRGIPRLLGPIHPQNWTAAWGDPRLGGGLFGWLARWRCVVAMQLTQWWGVICIVECMTIRRHQAPRRSPKPTA